MQKCEYALRNDTSPTSHITIKIKESELKFPPRQDEFFRFRVKRLS